MAIKLFNLISGQECLVDIKEEKENSYICKNIIQLIPDPQNGGVAMIGYPMFKEDSEPVEIGKDKIICESNKLFIYLPHIRESTFLSFNFKEAFCSTYYL